MRIICIFLIPYATTTRQVLPFGIATEYTHDIFSYLSIIVGSPGLKKKPKSQAKKDQPTRKS